MVGTHYSAWHKGPKARGGHQDWPPFNPTQDVSRLRHSPPIQAFSRNGGKDTDNLSHKLLRARGHHRRKGCAFNVGGVVHNWTTTIDTLKITQHT